VIFKSVDENGVDLVTGKYHLAIQHGSVGSGPGALTLTEKFSGTLGHNLQAYFHRVESGSDVTIQITFGDSLETFTGDKSATSFNSDQGSGAVLTKLSSTSYRLTAADGTRTTYGWPENLQPYQGGNAAFCATGHEAICSLLVTNTTSPNGLMLTRTWRAGENCLPYTLPNGEIVYNCVQYYRQESVQTSSGSKVTFLYQNNTDPSSGLPPSSWHKRIGATFWNGATQVGSSTLTYPSSTVTELTDIGGRTWR